MLLTVDEAARLPRVGRSHAYNQTLANQTVRGGTQWTSVVLNGQSAVTELTPQRRCTNFEDTVPSATLAPDVDRPRPAFARGKPEHREAPSGDELEGVAVCGAHDCEVTMVERGDGVVTEAFSDGHDRGINEPKTEIGVGTDQNDGALVVGGGEIDNREPGASDEGEESRFGCGAEAGFDQPRGFRDDRRGDSQFGPVAQQGGAVGVRGSLRSAEETKMPVSINSTVERQMP